VSLFCIVISFLGHGTVFFAVPNSFFSTTQDLLLVANELSILAVGTEPARQDIENIIRLLFKTIQTIYNRCSWDVLKRRDVTRKLVEATEVF